MEAVSMSTSGYLGNVGGHGGMMGSMGSAVGSDAVAGGLAGPGAGGIVSRPRLFERLAAPARVTVVSAPPGSGKTVLLRSWIGRAGLTDCAAWVPVGRDEADPQPFWLSVLAALRRTGAGSALVQPLTAAPALDGWGIVERLLADLAPLAERLWLVADDVHELGQEALGQLELLILRAPSQLRFVLATRHDVRLGLHRARLEGELAEVRGPELRFTLAEAEELFADAGVQLSSLSRLMERTEGWAAGLRLAALSLAGHPEPERFAEEFSGSERTVAEYLLAEVLDRQPEPVRRLLLRTSILDSVNGELADLLTGATGGERLLQDLEATNAFVVALDAGRSWFRYHRLFSGLLQLELRRAEPDEVTGLHHQAAEWLAGHGQPVPAIQQAQAARDWPLAARLLADHWPGLYLDGQAAATHQLLAGFPAEQLVADAELAAVAAQDELEYGSLNAAEHYLALAEREAASVSDARRAQVQLLLGVVRLSVVRQHGDLSAVANEARRLESIAEGGDPTQPRLGDDLRALALIHLGATEYWTVRFAAAMQHLDQGRALAHRIGRPYLEFTGLGHLAAVEFFGSFAAAAEHGRQVIELARQHGWTDELAVGLAHVTLGGMLAWQMRLEEAEPLIRRAELAVRAEAQPMAAMQVYFNRALLELGRGGNAEAVAALHAAERLGGLLVLPNQFVTVIRAMLVHTLIRLGDVEGAEEVLTQSDDHERGRGEWCTALAVLRLAQDNPSAATAALAPALDGSAPLVWQPWLAQAFLLEAMAQDSLGDAAAAGLALEGALDLAEPDGVMLWFVLNPAPDLLERHARQRTAHAALVADILSQLAGRVLAPQLSRPEPLLEALSDSEIRVLRYLPTNLTGPEIARELYVSRNTVGTHIRHLYEKFGTHTRADTVARGRALGLLAPSPQ
jgi:LuxR family maltose regulon positive regulatory protein